MGLTNQTILKSALEASIIPIDDCLSFESRSGLCVVLRNDVALDDANEELASSFFDFPQLKTDEYDDDSGGDLARSPQGTGELASSSSGVDPDIGLFLPSDGDTQDTGSGGLPSSDFWSFNGVLLVRHHIIPPIIHVSPTAPLGFKPNAQTKILRVKKFV